MIMQAIGKQTVKRLPVYLEYVKALPDQKTSISAAAIARALGLNEVVVRKDLACVSANGKPKIGYDRAELTKALEHLLGYNDLSHAVIVGAGRLGHALLEYQGFDRFGLDIIAAFDNDDALTDKKPGSKPIFPVSRLQELCQRLGVKVGIITVPATQAQSVCDQLVAAGILGIWNFAPVHLKVPETVIVQDENLAVSFAVLQSRLKQRLL